VNTYSVTVRYGRLPTEMRAAPVEMVRRSQRAGVSAALPYVHRRLSLVTPSGATGIARQSVTMETSFANSAHGFVGYSGMASTYIGFVNDGTRTHWAPIAPLKLWAKRVVGNEAFAYYLQRRIAGVIPGRPGGTKAQQFVEKLVAQERSRVQQMMIDAMLAEFHKTGSGEAPPPSWLVF